MEPGTAGPLLDDLLNAHLPVAVPDDTVRYQVYFDPGSVSTEAEAEQVARSLVSWWQSSECEATLRDRVWQRDPLVLYVVAASAEDPLHLEGSAGYGTCVDDEWFIVSLLLRATKQFPFLSVRVWDQDGEFLLIEAAPVLPPWASPANSSFTVWLRGGALRLLSPYSELPGRGTRSQEAMRVDAFVSAAAAHAALMQHPDAGDSGDADRAILAAIQARLSALPGEAERMHRTVIHVTKMVACVFDAHPDLVPRCIDAFYNRDASSLAVCRRMPDVPMPRGQSPVAINVSITRLNYAMLVQQQFHPPGPFISAGLAPLRHSEAWQALDLGCKLTCGLQMLLHELSRGVDTAAVAVPVTGDVFTVSPLPRRLDAAQVRNLLTAAAAAATDAEFAPVNAADDDRWMQIAPGDLEEVLTARFGDIALDQDATAAFDAQQILYGLDQLLATESEAAQGIDVPGARVDLDPQRFLHAIAGLDTAAGADDDVDAGQDTDDGDGDGGVMSGALDDEAFAAYLDGLDQEMHEAMRSDQLVPDGADAVGTAVLSGMLSSLGAAGGAANPAAAMLHQLGVQPAPAREEQ